MILGQWTPPASRDGKTRDELLVSFDAQRPARLLIVPALFDEANKLRRLTISVMRALDAVGIDSALPDLPGCNESRAAQRDQSLARWRDAIADTARQFAATHVLTLRAGALLAPADLRGWRYSPLGGEKLLAGMMRAQIIATREAGRSEGRDDMLERARREGITLGGWELGPEMIRELETQALASAPLQSEIEQAQIGGAGLWLRAEPGESLEQAKALADMIAAAIGHEAQARV